MVAAPRLLILDCDGVLIRSERANLAYYNHLFETFGLEQVQAGDRARLALLHTLSTPQVVDAFFPPSLRPEALSYAGALDFARFAGLLEAEPGWDSVLPRLRARMSVAVATNRGISAHQVLESVGLLRYMDLVVTVRDVARPKPHPDLLFRVLEHFAVAAADAFYIGDSALDRRAAAGADVPFLGFRDGSPDAAQSPEDVERRTGLVALAGVSDSMASVEFQNPQETKEISDEPEGYVPRGRQCAEEGLPDLRRRG